MRFLTRRRQRKALLVARLLVELEDVARERHSLPRRRSLRTSLGGAR